jgi:hypothetical protein
MLSVVGGGQNIEVTKLLMEAKCSLILTDPVQNNVLHLAAFHQNYAALDLLLDRWPKEVTIDLSSRNKKGETVFSIATDLKDEKAIQILKRYEGRYGDQSEEQAQNLLEDLMKEEERKELEKQKKKDKKKNAKLKHIAEKEGVTVDELRERHQAENEARRAEEDREKVEEEARIAREHAAVAEEERRRREIRERAQREQEQEEPAKGATTARKAATQKSVKFAEDPVQVAPKQQATLVETQFTHVKVKKPEEREQVAA